jgi:hypothetical protein
MDRCPETRHARIKPRHRRLVREIGAADETHALMPFVGKALRLAVMDIRDMTKSARRQQRPDHRAAQRTRAAADDDLTIAIIHGDFSVGMMRRA